MAPCRQLGVASAGRVVAETNKRICCEMLSSHRLLGRCGWITVGMGDVTCSLATRCMAPRRAFGFAESNGGHTGQSATPMPARVTMSGRGLGLSIVAAIVQKEGGELLAGPSKRGGATFGFAIPVTS